MRAALLMCGQPRTMEFCFPSVKRHILDVYQPDVFVCSDEQEERLGELFHPTAMDIRPQDEIDKEVEMLRSMYAPYDHNVIPPIQTKDLSAAWKVYRAAEMKREHEFMTGFIYDVVLISRFDVKFAGIQPIKNVEENVIYVPRTGAYWITPPDRPGIHWHGYSTHLCWMSSKVADMTAGIYFEGEDNYKIACEVADWGYIPEHVLKNFFDRNGIRAEFVEISMMLIRGTAESPLAFDHRPLTEYPQYSKRA
jgi:hypothetical protein